MAGAVSLGIPRNPDYNGAIQEGVSYAQRTIKNGLRVSAATAFLHPAMKRPNVRITRRQPLIMSCPDELRARRRQLRCGPGDFRSRDKRRPVPRDLTGFQDLISDGVGAAPGA